MIRININIPIIKDNMEYLIKKICQKLNIKKDNIISYKIHKKSIDARDKNNILYNYTVDLNLNKKLKNYKEIKEEKYKFSVTGKNKIKGRICIIGSGPAGLFAGYMLSKYGYKPLIIERGEKIEDRIKSIDEFLDNNKLNINSNIQFGEGGAGTFSDGKLNTLIKNKDHLMEEVFDIFIQNGADPSIKYLSHPHIGTDKLREIIINMRNKIISMGGEFRYNCLLEDLIIKDHKLEGIIANNEKIKTNLLILAIGHSARDTILMLHKYLKMESKPFAVGLRISHPREVIDSSEYGKFYKLLPPAYYKLTYHTDNHGIYTFCMCPGGYVINASSEEKRLAINGMSNSKRDSLNSNSAIVITVNKNDYGDGLFDGMKYQEKIEEKAFNKANGLIPIQLYKDFKENKESVSLGKVKPIFKGKYKLTNLRGIYSKKQEEDFIEAIEYFGKKIKDFNMDDAIIAMPETRTSSPIRILRNNDMEAINGVYPIGEGAGYAGGITSSAVDGIKCFIKISKKYTNQI